MTRPIGKSGEKSADNSASQAPTKKRAGRAKASLDSGTAHQAVSSGTVPMPYPPTLRSAGKQEWVEMFPNGISVASGLSRPILILKDKSQADVLPVWIHPLDAGVALAELSQGSSGLTPHTVTYRLLESLELRLETCAFVELIGHHQFVVLGFAGESGERQLRVRADEAMSFCLQGRARFFCTRAYMAQCRSLDADLSKLEHNLMDGQLPALQAEMTGGEKKHPYMM